MWTSTLDLSPERVLLTNLLGRFWRGAYFSSFAPLRVQNAPRQPLPDISWVRVRNRLAGICGSDLHLIYADGDLRVAPAALPAHTMTYLGHEVVGEVIEIGDDVQQLQVGDHVVLQHGPNCLSSGIQPLCRSCASGNYGLCERGTLPGPQPIGGGWSEEMLLHEQQLFRVPSDMSDTQAVLLEPSAVALHTVLRHVPQAGDRVLIIGAGTIGLLTLQAVRALAPQTEISVQARYPFQVEKATRMGAAHIIYPQDSYAGVQQATQAQLYTGMLGNKMLLGGYDVIYDTIGNSKTIHNALRWARAKGTVVLVGLHLHMMHIDLTPIWYQEINLIGTLGQGMETWPLGSNGQRSTFSITADMIMNNVLRPEQLITHHFALNDYKQALLTASDKREQRAIKVVFDYSLLPPSVVPNVRASARQRRQSPVDTRALSPLSTRDLTPKEPVVQVSEHSVAHMPITTSGDTSELPPRIVPARLTDVTPSIDVSTSSDAPQISQEEVIGTGGAHSSEEASVTSLHTVPEPIGEDVEETPTISLPTFTEPTEEHIEEVPMTSLPAHDATEQHVEEALVVSLPAPSLATDETHIAVTEQGEETPPAFDEEPLNELEWLDVTNAEEDMPEVQYVPDETDTSPLPKDEWLDKSLTEQDNNSYEDIAPDENIALEVHGADRDIEKEETATNTARETFMTTKKPTHGNKSRSKNRQKGKHTTGSFRS